MRTGLIKIAALAVCGFVAFAAKADSVPHWQVLADKSSIEWTAIYGGNEVKGTFPAFTADIAFDPNNLAASKASVKVEMGKVKTDDKDAQANLPMKDWFDAQEFPLATFETTTFTHTKDDEYQAVGMLTIRGQTGKTTLPFMIKFYDDKDTAPSTHFARVEGEFSIKRVDFGVGQGEWVKTDTIGNDVKISVHLEAKQVP